MSDDLPKVVHEGTLKIGDVEVKVHHLDDGRRVIASEDMAKVMLWLAGDSDDD